MHESAIALSLGKLSVAFQEKYQTDCERIGWVGEWLAEHVITV